MSIKEIIEQTPPAKLSKARGRLQAHSTRDKPKFLKQLDHIIETFKNLGYELEGKEIKKGNR